MGISSEEFDVITGTEGIITAPCRLVGNLEVKRATGGGYFAQVTVVGWDEEGIPLILLPNGHLGALTLGMTLGDVTAF